MDAIDRTISDGTSLDEVWFHTQRKKLHDEFKHSSNTENHSYRTEVDDLENRIRLAEQAQKTQESRDFAVQLAQLHELHALRQQAVEQDTHRRIKRRAAWC